MAIDSFLCSHLLNVIRTRSPHFMLLFCCISVCIDVGCQSSCYSGNVSQYPLLLSVFFALLSDFVSFLFPLCYHTVHYLLVVKFGFMLVDVIGIGKISGKVCCCFFFSLLLMLRFWFVVFCPCLVLSLCLALDVFSHQFFYFFCALLSLMA